MRAQHSMEKFFESLDAKSAEALPFPDFSSLRQIGGGEIMQLPGNWKLAKAVVDGDPFPAKVRMTDGTATEVEDFRLAIILITTVDYYPTWIFGRVANFTAGSPTWFIARYWQEGAVKGRITFWGDKEE